MFEIIGEFDDPYDRRAADLGLSGFVENARTWCSPRWHGYAGTASISAIFALSKVVETVEDRWNSLGQQEAAEHGWPYTPEHGSASLLLSQLKENDLDELPPPFKGCTDASTPFLQQPAVLMMLAAQALSEIDRAGACLRKGEVTAALNHLSNSSNSISIASQSAGRQYAAQKAREAAREALLERSSNGGLARAERYQPIKDWLRDQLAAGKWNGKSARQAAKALEAGALEMNRRHECKLSEDRAFTTIYEWILDLRRDKSA
ncbi:MULTISPECIES: hypothetical protein [unclassified Caballeronia]|uniref:hypothetical protein n=1 Tax=unclassified Caballeronia TaxID=2646786 RepID=UPI00202932FF|nr:MULTISPECIES: hypothetical protein [unclassified Caballeronia]